MRQLISDPLKEARRGEGIERTWATRSRSTPDKIGKARLELELEA